ncbi:MAG: 50S ribosomal protein L18 [Elusimicrobia bacterium]|nr:50S ribosomal protein L18 [Elusimicrobiota bacterium]
MRKRITGTTERPRLVIYRSNRNIFAQIVNDFENKVILGASTLTAEIKKKNLPTPRERAKEVGKYIAKKAAGKKIKKVVFDRQGYKYHGNVKELADGAREGGLEF